MNKRQLEKSPNVWKVSNIFQYNPWERWSHNGHFKILTEWKLKYGTSKVCSLYTVKGKFIALNIHIRKE